MQEYLWLDLIASLTNSYQISCPQSLLCQIRNFGNQWYSLIKTTTVVSQYWRKSKKYSIKRYSKIFFIPIELFEEDIKKKHFTGQNKIQYLVLKTSDVFWSGFKVQIISIVRKTVSFIINIYSILKIHHHYLLQRIKRAFWLIVENRVRLMRINNGYLLIFFCLCDE